MHPEAAELCGCCRRHGSMGTLPLPAAGRRPDVVGLEDMIARTYPPENALMPGIHCPGLVSISRWPAWECRIDHDWGGYLFVVAWWPR